VSEFGWGDTEFVGHAVRDAALSAKNYSPQVEAVWQGLAATPISGQEINLALLLKKYVLVEILYRKYFFFELLIQYAEENPSEDVVLAADKGFSEPYEERLAKTGIRVRWNRRSPGFSCAFALAALPWLMPLYWRRKIEPCGYSVDG
jgi:hypothetical protein